jgi:glycosyltransferase involved in cell wall biosynthesis
VARHAVQARLLAAGELPPQLLIHAGMKPYFERSGLGEQDMIVLPNPVVPYCRQRVQAEANHDVLFVGRMEETKGIDIAAEACRRAGARLVAVGDGALLDRLRDKYPEMLFAGRLAPQDIGALAERARMLVMPSRHSEPFGLTAVEALWSGLPVLASEHALIADSIRQAGAGLSIDPLDVQGFADAIVLLMRDDALTRRMSLAAFERTDHLALEPDAWIDALLAAYRALLAGGRTELALAAAAWTAAAATPHSRKAPAGAHA